MNGKSPILMGTIIAIVASFLLVGNMPKSEFTGDIDLNLNYILYTPLENWLYIPCISAGMVDVEITSIPAGVYTQDRHYAKLHVSVETAPGNGKFVNVTLSDGTNSLTVSIAGAETSGVSTTTAFDLDVSAETLSLFYSRTAGGGQIEGCIMFQWWYKENE